MKSYSYINHDPYLGEETYEDFLSTFRWPGPLFSIRKINKFIASYKLHFPDVKHWCSKDSEKGVHPSQELAHAHK